MNNNNNGTLKRTSTLHYGAPVSEEVALKYNVSDNNGRVRIPFDESEMRTDSEEPKARSVEDLVPSVEEIIAAMDGGRLRHNAKKPKPRPDENTKYSSPQIEKQVKDLASQMEQEVPDIDSDLPTVDDIKALMDAMSQDHPEARRRFLQMQSNHRELSDEEMDKMIAGSTKRIR